MRHKETKSGGRRGGGGGGDSCVLLIIHYNYVVLCWELWRDGLGLGYRVMEAFEHFLV